MRSLINRLVAFQGEGMEKIAKMNASPERMAIASCRRGEADMIARIANKENGSIPHKTLAGSKEPVMIQCDPMKFAVASSCKRKNGRRTW